MATLVHITNTSAKNESRLFRECSLAVQSHCFDKVIVIARWEEGLEEHELHSDGFEILRWIPRCSLPGRLGWVEKQFSWKNFIIENCRKLQPTVLQIHALILLPKAKAIQRMTGCQIVYDCHELETEVARIPEILRAVYRRIEKKHIHSVDATIVVGDKIAQWYESKYGIQPVVLRNFPILRQEPSLDVPDDLLRKAFEIPEDHLIFLYNGHLVSGRRVEQLLRVFGSADSKKHIIFMGYGPLEKEIREASKAGNIHFHPAVPSSQVIDYTRSADVGWSGVENVCLSYYYSMPNKLFEYLAAGVPSVAPDFPEMAHYIKLHNCGWLHQEGDDEILSFVQGLSHQDVLAAKERVKAIDPPYSWSMEQPKLKALYEGLTQRRH